MTEILPEGSDGDPDAALVATVPAAKRRLVDYDAAWQGVVRRALDGFVAAHSLLGKVVRHPSQHAGPIRNVRSPRVLDQLPQLTESTARISKRDLSDCNVEMHTKFVSELASEQVSGMVRTLFRSADAVSEAAGTSHDSAGQPISWDLILQMLEGMSVTFNQDGRPNPPLLVAHPDVIAKLPAMSEAQQARCNEIFRKKGEEHAAQKRTRRLPR